MNGSTAHLAEHVGKNVAQRRQQLGLKQTELSQRLRQLGMPNTTPWISHVENGHAVLRVDTLIVFALALEISPVKLLMPRGPEAVQLSDEAQIDGQDLGMMLAFPDRNDHGLTGGPAISQLLSAVFPPEPTEEYFASRYRSDRLADQQFDI